MKKKISKRAKELLKKVPFGFSKVLHVYEDRDFCQFILYEAGDTVTFRVYDDGRIYER